MATSTSLHDGVYIEHLLTNIADSYGNRSRCHKPLFQSEASWEAITMKMGFLILTQLKLVFTRKVLARSLVLKVRVLGTR